MAVSPEDLFSSTKIIVRSLQTRNPLKSSMRGGLLYLAYVLVADMSESLMQDDDERGVERLGRIDTLAIGWEHIAQRLDYKGREFHDATSADAAEMHYTLAQGYALGVYDTGERNETNITHLAFMLGEYVMHVTKPTI